MGGVRGSQSVTFGYIDGYVQLVNEAVTQDLSLLTPSQLDVAAATLPDKSAIPYSYLSGSVNLRNAYQEGDDDLPLQFQYQAADCRLFYTAQSIDVPSTIWSLAKAAIWENKGCVSNSTGGPGSLADRSKNQTSGHGNTPGNGNSSSSWTPGSYQSGCEDVRPRGLIFGIVTLSSIFMAFL